MTEAVNAVASTAFGAHYEAHLERLKRSLDAVGFGGTRLWWPGGAARARHEVAPYGFKIDAVEAAVGLGAGVVFWLDPSIVVLKPLDPIFARAAKSGVLLVDNPPHKAGEWCSDLALPLLGWRDRDEAMAAPACTTSVFGIDVRSSMGRSFLADWKKLRDAGAFVGPRRNRVGEASRSWLCKGHRHDQSAADALAWRQGVRFQPGLPWFVDASMAPANGETIVILRRGLL